MLVIPLGFACNNACVFCAQGDLRARDAGGDGRTDEVRARLEATPPGGAVAFIGGEPTLDERLTDWIRAADERGAARILLQTNGRRLAYRGYAAALRDASPRLSLDVSLHGSTAPMHDYHTSTPGSFAQTVTGLKHARDAGIPFAVTTVITRSNFRHLPEIVRLAGALGARAIQLSPAVRHGSAARSADRVIPAPELVAPYLARALTDAAAQGLGWRAADRESAPGVAGWFAGLGPVEQAETTMREPAHDSPPGAQRRVSLPMLSRPAPGRAEVRSRERRTGAELRQIFPGLFEAGDRGEGVRGRSGAGPRAAPERGKEGAG